MSSARRLYGAFERSDGRIKLMTLLGVSGLVAVLAMFMVLPALAGSGGPSGSGVQPDEVSYGGGSGACAVYSDAAYELHINNPVDGTFTGPDDTEVLIDVSPNTSNPNSNSRDLYFDFTFVNNPAVHVYDIVVNGGAKNTHYDYDEQGTSGVVRDDTSLHAPTKGGSNNLYKLSHINICYEELPIADLNVTKVATTPSADVGDVVEFKITVRNNGPATATNVVVTDLLPETEDGAPLMSLADVAGNDDWDLNTDGQPTQMITSIAPGAANEVTISIFLEIEMAAAGRDDVTNGVNVSADQEDPNGGDNGDNSEPVITVTADVSGKKFHDRDTDGLEDETFEEGLGEFTITAFQDDEPVASVQTDAETGAYTFEDLAPGEYLICEATTDEGLPTPGSGFTWMWRQSVPSGNTDCEGLTSNEGETTYEPAGQTIAVDEPIEDVDFGNFIQAAIYCGDGPVTVEFPEPGTDDTPRTTVEIPEDSPSCMDAEDPWIVTLDLGLNADTEAADFSQFVVFGDGTAGNPDLSKVITQTIVWVAEEPDYTSGDLTVPTTRVSYPDLADIVGAEPVERCSVTGGPSATTPLCLYERTVNEGGALGTKIQVTEVFKFLGDPGFFR